MTRLKVSDLELTERGWPLLVWASFQTDLLHISMHNGVWENPKKSKYANNRYFAVTKCNRPFEHPTHFRTDFNKLDNFQLCPRCGTREDFKAALEIHKAALATLRLEREEKEAERQAELQRAAEVRAKLASYIASLLYRPPWMKTWAKDGKVFVKYEGVLYRLPVMEEKEE